MAYNFSQFLSPQQTGSAAKSKAPQLSSADLTILKEFKRSGHDAATAFSKLNKLKSRYGSSEAVLQKAQGMIGTKQAPAEGAPNMPYADPLTMGLVGMGKGALSTIEGGVQLAKKGLNLTGLKTASQLNGTDTGEYIPKSWRTANNPFEQAGFMAEQTSEYFAPGAALKGASLPGKLRGIGKVAGGALGTAGVTALQEGDINGKVAIGGIVGGAIPLVGMGLKAIRPMTTTARGKLAGLSDETIATLKSKAGGKTIKNLSRAEEALKRPLKTKDPMQYVGSKVFKPSVQKLSQTNKKLGSNLGQIFKKTNKKIVPKQALIDFKQAVRKLGGRVGKDGKIVFRRGSRKLSNTDVNELNRVLSDLTYYAKRGGKPQAIHRTMQSIDDVINYASSGRFADSVSKVGETPLKAARRSLRSLLGREVPKAGKVMDKFAEQRKVIDFFNKKLGEQSASTTPLYNLFSKSAKDEAIPMLQKLSKYTGRDILKEVRAAKTAMDIAGDPAAKSLLETGITPTKSGMVQAGIRAAVNPKKQAINIYKLAQKQGKDVNTKGAEFLLRSILGIT